MFKITFTKKNYESAIEWFLRYEEALDKPEVMAAGIPPIGVGMAENFQSESEAAPWAPLSEYTNRQRVLRGYKPEHPILQQSGGLKRITADMMRKWTLQKIGGFESDGSGASIAAFISRRHFKATVNGPKVANHYGGVENLPGGRSIRLPRRRFFGITEDAAQKSAEAMMEQHSIQWARMSSYAKRY